MHRLDICEVYYVLESDYNVSGMLQERSSNQRRKMSTGYQLHRMGFTMPPLRWYKDFSADQSALYHELEVRYGFKLAQPIEVIAIWDSPEFIDRYTMIFDDGEITYYYTLNDGPAHPQGFCQFGGFVDPYEDGCPDDCVEIGWFDLPISVHKWAKRVIHFARQW